MKKSLLAGIALAALIAAPTMAADLGVRPAPAYKAPAPIAVGYNWTGIYIGANAGGGWGRKCWTNNGTVGNLSIDDGCHNVSGFLGGGQIGGNYQVGQFVFGVEGSGDWANLTGSHNTAVVNPDTLSTTVNSIIMATGRVGVAWDALLVYAKGGGAWAHDKYSEVFNGASFGDASEWRTGWTVGGGLEYGFGPNWSVAAEYDYVGLGTKTLNLINPTTNTTANFESINQYIHMGTVRLNYRFGPSGAIAARY